MNYLSYYKINFLLHSYNNIINNSFGTFILFVLVLNNEYIFASNLAIISSFIIVVTKIFSLNLRNIYIAKTNDQGLDNHIIIRFFLSIVIFFSCSFLAYIFLDIQNKVLYFLILLFIIQWIIELNLVKIELQKDYNKIKLLSVINTLIISGIIISTFTLNFIFFNNLIFVYLLFLIYFFLNSIKLKKTNLEKKFYKNLYLEFKRSLFSNSFLSSFSLNIANLIWRILVSILVGKSLASIFFFFYSLGSFPGTIFNVSFGPNMVKRKLKPKLLILFFSFYLVILFFVLSILLSNNEIYSLETNLSNYFFINIATFSILGSIFMLFAMYFRQIQINYSPNISNQIFLKDVFVSCGIVLIIPILFFLGGIEYLAFSYFFASIISIIIYYQK